MGSGDIRFVENRQRRGLVGLAYNRIGARPELFKVLSGCVAVGLHSLIQRRSAVAHYAPRRINRKLNLNFSADGN